MAETEPVSDAHLDLSHGDGSTLALPSPASTSPGRRRLRRSMFGRQRGRWFDHCYTLGDVHSVWSFSVFGETRQAFNVVAAPLWIIPPRGTFRRAVVRVVDHPAFDKVILAVILLNCVVELLDIPSLRGVQWADVVRQWSELTFFVVYVAEAMLRVLACGFALHAHAYLRNPWNVLDFVIVLTSGWSLFLGGSNLSTLRLLRVARPLRAIRRVRGIRVLIRALLAALPMMGDVLMLITLLAFIFALFAFQLWKGAFHRKCYWDNSGTLEPVVNDSERLCGARDCADVPGLNITCTVQRSRYTRDILNFDNSGTSIFLVLRVLTVDSWHVDAEMLQDSTGELSWVFFVILTLIGGYLGLNLIIAVLCSVFSESSQRSKQLQNVVVPKEEVVAPSHTEYMLSVPPSDRRVKRKKRDADSDMVRKRYSAEALLKRLFGRRSLTQYREDTAAMTRRFQERERRERLLTEEENERLSERRTRGPVDKRTIPDSLNLCNLLGSHHLQFVSCIGCPVFMTPAPPPELDDGCSSDRDSLGQEADKEEGDWQESEEDASGAADPDAPARPHPVRRTGMRDKVAAFVSHRLFEKGMLVVTMINIAALLTDYHGITSDHELTVTTINYVAAVIFLLELALKMFATGVKDYFLGRGLRGGEYNTLDFIVVVCSLPDLAMLSRYDSTGMGSALAGLRAFRAFRLLVHTSQQLRDLITAAGAAVSVIASLLMLLLLVIFMFSLLGLSLFYDSFPDSSRANFNSLWESALTVFIVVTGDGWSTIAADGMRGTSAFAVIFFLVLLVVGTFMCGYLFLAVLVDAMASEALRQRRKRNREELEQLREDTREAALSQVTRHDSELRASALAPSDLTSAGNDDEAPTSAGSAEEGSEASESASAAEGPERLKVDSWEVSMSATRLRPYWTNVVTGKTTWTNPWPPLPAPTGGQRSSMGSSHNIFQLLLEAQSEALTARGGSFASRSLFAFSIDTPTTAPPPDRKSPTAFHTGDEVDVWYPSGGGGDWHRGTVLGVREMGTLAVLYDTGVYSIVAGHHARPASEASTEPGHSSSCTAGVSSRTDISTASSAGIDDCSSSLQSTSHASVPSTSSGGDEAKGDQTPPRHSLTASRVPSVFQDESTEILITKLVHYQLSQAMEMSGLGGLQRLWLALSKEGRSRLERMFDSDETGPKRMLLSRLAAGGILAPQEFDADAAYRAEAVAHAEASLSVEEPAPQNPIADVFPAPPQRAQTLRRVRQSVRFTLAPLTLTPPTEELGSAWLGNDGALGGAAVRAALAAPQSHADAAEARADAQEQREMEAEAMSPRSPLASRMRWGDQRHRRRSVVGDPDRSDALVSQYDKAEEQRMISANALGCLPMDNPVRARLNKLVHHRWFPRVILLVILINAIFLTLDDHYASDRPGGRGLLRVMNVVFVSIFFLEFLAKIIVLGFWRAENAYLRSLWNRIDLIVLIVDVWEVLPLNNYGTHLLRGMRTIRLLIRSPEIKVVCALLLSVLPNVLTVSLVVLFFWVVFGIVGVAAFKGQHYYCTDPSMLSEQTCTGAYSLLELTATGNVTGTGVRSWELDRLNFNNIGNAFVALFELSVGDEWAALMWRTVDTGVGEGPLRNRYPAKAVYFVAFALIGRFFCANLTVAVLVNSFQATTQNGSALLTVKQRNWVRVRRIISRFDLQWRPNEPSRERFYGLRHRCFVITQNPMFEAAILLVIVLNCLAMATQYDGETDTHRLVVETAGYVFTGIFALEAAMKMLALGLADYFRQTWNRFDFFCVAASVIGLLFSLNAGVIRVARIARLFRLLRGAERVRMLLKTLLRSLPAMANVFMLMAYAYYNWGIVGVSLFKDVDPIHMGHGEGFRSFPSSLLVLFQISTTEGWQRVMEGTMLAPPACSEAEGNCGHYGGERWRPMVYFYSFLFVGAFIFSSMFIYVVLQNLMQYRKEAAGGAKEEFDCAFQTFRELWVMRFDPYLTRKLSVDDFLMLASKLPEPLWRKSKTRAVSDQPCQCDDCCELRHEVQSRGIDVGWSFEQNREWLSLLRNVQRLPIPVSVELAVRFEDCVLALAMRAIGLRKQDKVEAHSTVARLASFAEPVFLLEHIIAARRIEDLYFRYKDRMIARDLQRQKFENDKKKRIIEMAKAMSTTALRKNLAKAKKAVRRTTRAAA
eukprot:TRINITY_DN10272_c0_g1_i1.p1 TRINITY_DN10272_c0_g1~~TRINITY_DN10272_c0_g1_i1.p1  ORF type:complete len:2172 (+),score=636.31 TRINITY_DN10272_c0_g1_i1:53-6517(+)